MAFRSHSRLQGLEVLSDNTENELNLIPYFHHRKKWTRWELNPRPQTIDIRLLAILDLRNQDIQRDKVPLKFDKFNFFAYSVVCTYRKAKAVKKG